VQPRVENLLSKHTQTKVKLVSVCEMEKPHNNSSVWYFHSKTTENLDGTDRNELYNEAKDTMVEKMGSENMQGSNWRLKRVVKLAIYTSVYKPLKGSSYIPLPKKLAVKKAIITMKNNNDDQCFKWCVTRAFNPVKVHKERIDEKLIEQSEKQFNWNSINFPTSWKDIDKFERQNSKICINVFG